MTAGDALRFIIGGGGGWGDPLARDVEKVAADVRNGLVSARAAELAYGVVIVDGAVDTGATSALRADLAAQREAGTWRVPTAAPLTWIL